MPSFHTKTIESILDPVAQQVSKLIILHEEAEAGSAMPDLQLPVAVVKQAVENLIKVGYDTISHSDDQILKQDMPPSLRRVEEASDHLRDASGMLKSDSYSVLARRKLIDGSRGILQGTSAVLLTFDLSEVRKIIRQCKNVLDVLAVTEVVDSMEHLVEFVKSLTPCLSRMTQEVDARQKELTHQTHAEILQRSLDQVKSLTPILISSIKMYVTTRIASNSSGDHGGVGVAESQANRDFVVVQMSEEIQEMIRVLQLTSAEDAAGWYDDDLAAMRACKAAIDGRLAAGQDWLLNPQGVLGSAGEKALRQVLAETRRVGHLTGDLEEREEIDKLASELDSLVDSLAEYRLRGEGQSAPAQSLVHSCRAKLGQLVALASDLVGRAERQGVHRPARTLDGKLGQAQRWLASCGGSQAGPQAIAGAEACRALLQEARRLPELMASADHADRMAARLNQLSHDGALGTSEAQQLALSLSHTLSDLRDRLQGAIVDQVADNFIDVNGPLRQLIEAATLPPNTPGREEIFHERASAFLAHAERLCQTAELVGSNAVDGQDLIRLLAGGHLPGLGSQVVQAGRLVQLYGGSLCAPPVADHLDLMRRHWSEGMERLRSLVDEAIDTGAFIRAQEAGILRDTRHTEDSIARASTTGVVEGTSNIARRANRVLQVAKQEADNSEDASFVDNVNDAVSHLRATLTPMVVEAKSLVSNLHNVEAQEHWRSRNRDLISAVGGVRQTVLTAGSGLPVQEMQQLVIQAPSDTKHRGPDTAPQFLGAAPGHNSRSPAPGSPETDTEDEFNFPAPEDNQPILAAAHVLHQEAKQWSSQDNEIISAAKRMASLMAQLSQIVRGEQGTKKDLIDVAKAIADASEEVTRCAKQLARDCTDKRMRMNLLQVCERIPTMGTQLKILSTVKATMLGSQGSDEDQEATEMLVGNAQNLMQSVVDTVHAAEAASIRMRVDSGLRIRWVRRGIPWYQNRA